MQIYHTLTPAPAPQDSAVALGYFDGVHSGHRAVLGHGHYVYGDAVGGTELLQQRYIACGVSTKGKVVATEDRLCMEAVHQHTADKILRREGAELLKGWLPILGDTQLGHAGVLLRQ